jgi:hypothetical protein
VRYIARVFLVEKNTEVGVGAIWLGLPSLDSDWGEYIRVLDEFNRIMGAGVRPVLVQIIQVDEMPSAVVRRELGELRKRIRPDVINAVVSQESVVRYIQVALNWLHKPHYDSTVHATVDAAFEHIKRALGAQAGDRRLAALQGLVAELERRAGH